MPQKLEEKDFIANGQLVYCVCQNAIPPETAVCPFCHTVRLPIGSICPTCKQVIPELEKEPETTPKVIVETPPEG